MIMLISLQDFIIFNSSSCICRQIDTSPHQLRQTRLYTYKYIVMII